MSDIWSWQNAVDATGAIISSSTGSSGELVTTNIRDPRVSRIWRAGDMPVELSVQLPGTSGISVVGLFGVNFSDLGTVTIKLGTTVGAGDLWEEEVDPLLVTLGTQAVFPILDGDGAASPVSASYLTVTADSGAPMEIGRIWAGGADWQASIGHTVRGSSWGGTDLSKRSVTNRSGAYLIERGSRRRSFTASYDAISQTEYEGALFEMDERGLAGQMLFVPVPSVYDSHKFSILGYLEDIPDTGFVHFLTAGRTLNIREAG